MRSVRLGVWVLAGVCASCAGLLGCATTGGAEGGEVVAAQAQRARLKNLSHQGLEAASFDLNRDQQADQWRLSEGDKVVRVERDVNFDGKADMYVYPNSKGEPLEEELDLDVDGVIDVVNFYRGGVLSRKEVSPDFSGKFTVVKFYKVDGMLERLEQDSNGDGKVDWWEYYEEGGAVRVERDGDGDGQPDGVQGEGR
jgi:hypothetical protein